jgi:hypothetical protein
MCFVFIYENRRMKPVEIVLRRVRRGRRKNDGGSKYKIHCKHIRTYHDVSPVRLLYANKNSF